MAGETSVKAVAVAGLSPRGQRVGKTSITDMIESTLPPGAIFSPTHGGNHPDATLKGIALTTPQRCVVGTADGVHRTAVIREEEHNRIVG